MQIECFISIYSILPLSEILEKWSFHQVFLIFLGPLDLSLINFNQKKTLLITEEVSNCVFIKNYNKLILPTQNKSLYQTIL